MSGSGWDWQLIEAGLAAFIAWVALWGHRRSRPLRTAGEGDEVRAAAREACRRGKHAEAEWVNMAAGGRAWACPVCGQRLR